MSDNLVLKHLRAIRGDLTNIKLDIREIRHRMSALEITLASLGGEPLCRPGVSR